MGCYARSRCPCSCKRQKRHGDGSSLDLLEDVLILDGVVPGVFLLEGVLLLDGVLSDIVMLVDVLL